MTIRSWPDTVPPAFRTLGWEFAAFCTRWLEQPDGPDAGDPLVLTREQLRIALRWYEIDDEGRFVHRRGVLRRMKGWGKDPFAAALIWFEALGCCRFSHWEGGAPVAQQHPAAWIQMAAVSLEQNRNTMTLLGPMLSKDARDEFRVDVGKEITYFRGGLRIEVVTRNPRSLEGSRPSFVLMNETQHWVPANQGIEMAHAVRRNLGKSRDGSARSLAIQNAHIPGEESVAEEDYETWQGISDGRATIAGIYYDATEASPGTDLSDLVSLTEGLRQARGDSVWLDIDRLAEEAVDYPPEKTRRFYLNQVVAAADSLLSTQEFDRIGCEDVLADGDEITLGFDGGKTDDATALVAIRIHDRLVQPIRIWQKPQGSRDWEINREDVDGTVRWAMATYRVSAFFADVALWESYIDQWSIDYRNDLLVKASPRSAVGWDMRSGVKESTLANEKLLAAIVDEKVRFAETAPGANQFRSHVLNARRRLNRFGVSFGKENRESDRKVDGYAAALLADMARSRVLESGKRRGSRKVVILG